MRSVRGNIGHEGVVGCHRLANKLQGRVPDDRCTVASMGGRPDPIGAAAGLVSRGIDAVVIARGRAEPQIVCNAFGHGTLCCFGGTIWLHSRLVHVFTKEAHTVASIIEKRKDGKIVVCRVQTTHFALPRVHLGQIVSKPTCNDRASRWTAHRRRHEVI